MVPLAKLEEETLVWWVFALYSLVLLCKSCSQINRFIVKNLVNTVVALPMLEEEMLVWCA